MKKLTILITLLLIIFFFWLWPFWGMPFNSQRHGRPPLTPRWALECWLWEDDVNTAGRVDELLRGYAEHDIPVRTILIDSPWSTRYNDFIVDTLRYPQPEKWFRRLENDGYRVVLWMTSMLNSHSKDAAHRDSQNWFDNLQKQDFLANDGRRVKWWKGRGGFIDYTNPAAMDWWRSQQENVLALGIDGWKLDGAATYFSTKMFGLPLPFGRSKSGWLTTRHYMDLYYREEYEHGLSQNPEFVTLARALDGNFIHPEGFAPIDAAPVTWVGDQEHLWQAAETEAIFDDKILGGSEGLETAIRDILNSAELGYNIIGSDIAGFAGREIPPRLYIRWAQFSAFCGLFLNGGHGERALWKRTQQELEIIRKFSWLHTELVPYIYHYVVSAHRGGRVLLQPAGQGLHYFFGDDFLVAPIFQDSLDKTLHLPPGRWRYFFDDRQIITGGKSLRKSFPLEVYPVFVRDGAIIPLQIQRPYNGFGDSDSRGRTTWLIYPAEKNHFTLYHNKGLDSTKVTVQKQPHKITITVDGRDERYLLLVSMPNSPRAVLFNGHTLEKDEAWHFALSQQRLKIKSGRHGLGVFEIMP